MNKPNPSSKRLFISGYSGRMGQRITEQVTKSSHWDLFAGSGHGDIVTFDGEKFKPSETPVGELLEASHVVVDFSSAQGNQFLLDAASKANLSNTRFLIGSTGLPDEDQKKWKCLVEEAGVSVLFAPNTSLGISLLLRSALEIAKALHDLDFDIELIESHHRHKIDSPSGTAWLIANSLADKLDRNVITNRTGKRQDNEIGLAAMRGGSVFGEHQVHFLGDSEEITISHRALSRDLFAKGALSLSSWLHQQPLGKCYTLADVKL